MFSAVCWGLGADPLAAPERINCCQFRGASSRVLPSITIIGARRAGDYEKGGAFSVISSCGEKSRCELEARFAPGKFYASYESHRSYCPIVPFGCAQGKPYCPSGKLSQA